MNALRHAYGLRWQADRLTARDLAEWRGTLAGLAIILLIAGLVHTADYAEIQRAEAQRHAAIAEARETDIGLARAWLERYDHLAAQLSHHNTAAALIDGTFRRLADITRRAVD